MELRDITADLGRSLRQGRQLALLPLLLGTGFAALWILPGGEAAPWPLAAFALGAALTAGLVWLQGRLIDQRFLAPLARQLGLSAEIPGAALTARLPAGVVTMGTRQVVLNAVTGETAGRNWQAGFLECSHRDLNTGRTRAVFRGQLVQTGLNAAPPDFVLRDRHPARGHQNRIYPMGLPAVTEIRAAGRTWVLHTQDPAAAAGIALRCARVLERLPAPPAQARILGLVCTRGWLQLLCANPGDLFTLSQGMFPCRSPATALLRSGDALIWAGGAAAALMGYDGAGEDVPASQED